MDEGREHDLYALHGEFSDITRPMHERNRAYRTFQRIQRQIKDRNITKFRHRLQLAYKVGDSTEAEKISLQLEAYMYRQYGHAL